MGKPTVHLEALTGPSLYQTNMPHYHPSLVAISNQVVLVAEGMQCAGGRYMKPGQYLLCWMFIYLLQLSHDGQYSEL